MKKVSKLFLATFLATFLLNISVNAQTETKGYVVISTSTDYQTSLKKAKKAADKLGYMLDLRGLSENSTIGLTMDKSICDESGYDFPAYQTRGKFDDGNYVSIEFSNGFENCEKGKYFVVVASGQKGSPKLKKAFKKTKKKYKKAKMKYAKISLACSH